MTPIVDHWINGKPVRGTGTESGDVTDPSTGRVTARVAFSSSQDVAVAVAAAAAFPSWAGLAFPQSA